MVIGQDSNIQDGTTIHMTGGISTVAVGHRVTVGHNCILHGCNIEDDVLIGMGSIVMDNAVVHSGAFVAAATLITGGQDCAQRHVRAWKPHAIGASDDQTRKS